MLPTFLSLLLLASPPEEAAPAKDLYLKVQVLEWPDPKGQAWLATEIPAAAVVQASLSIPIQSGKRSRSSAEVADAAVEIDALATETSDDYYLEIEVAFTRALRESVQERPSESKRRPAWWLLLPWSETKQTEQVATPARQSWRTRTALNLPLAQGWVFGGVNNNRKSSGFSVKLVKE